jgi:hypothetical protein
LLLYGNEVQLLEASIAVNAAAVNYARLENEIHEFFPVLHEEHLAHMITLLL